MAGKRELSLWKLVDVENNNNSDVVVTGRLNYHGGHRKTILRRF